MLCILQQAFPSVRIFSVFVRVCVLIKWEIHSCMDLCVCAICLYDFSIKQEKEFYNREILVVQRFHDFLQFLTSATAVKCWHYHAFSASTLLW